MKKHLGVKIIQAEPCFGRNNKCVPENSEHDGTEVPGYKVVYEDGYTSWSPKEVFEKAYRPINKLTFGLAVEALKLGKRVTRTGWNGKGMWLKIVSPFDGKVNLGSNGVFEGLPWVGMKTADNMFVPWFASQTDILAEDWEILND